VLGVVDADYLVKPNWLTDLVGWFAIRAVWALRTLSGITVKRAALAFANFLALSWTVSMACAKGLVRRDGVFLRTPKWRDGGLREALRATRTETRARRRTLVRCRGRGIDQRLGPGNAGLRGMARVALRLRPGHGLAQPSH
jgi:hypothetical protein